VRGGVVALVGALILVIIMLIAFMFFLVVRQSSKEGVVEKTQVVTEMVTDLVTQEVTREVTQEVTGSPRKLNPRDRRPRRANPGSNWGWAALIHLTIRGGKRAVAEQNTEQTVMVRQVTDVHSNWSYQGELEHG
jgi:hypothetical protein